MRVVVFGFDNRALLEAEGHSSRWNARIGERLERLDVIVENRGLRGPGARQLTGRVRIQPVYVPHPLLYPTAALARVLVEHRRHRYDLATADDPFRAGLAALAFRRLTGVPFCVEYHTETLGNAAWVAERPLIHGAYSRIGAAVLAAAGSVRCVNERNRAQLAELTGREPSDLLIEAIPVPVDLYDPTRYDGRAREVRERLTTNPDDVVLLFLGRLAPVKHVDQLIEAFGQLSERHANVVLEIVGDGPERRRLEQLARGRGRIVFSGYVPEHEVHSHYGACDFFVNPSHSETYGRVYLEAMSAGKPVITTDGAGAVADGLCIDGKNALVVRVGDTAGLLAALERLVVSHELRAAFGAHGRQHVLEKFNYASLVQRVEDLWRRTARRGGAPRSSML
jgi:glycosyltransferase involved in cell wall biosynthesis